MKIADLYIRISLDERADSGYLQGYQNEPLLRYCDINNIKVRSIFFKDHSAKIFLNVLKKMH